MTTPRLQQRITAIQNQIAAVEVTTTAGSWRRRVAKARQLNYIRSAEASARRRLRPPIEFDDDLPF